jgi:hypothetical protein
MYSEITKIYYGKAVGHVFMKPVQIEGTTQKFYSQYEGRPKNTRPNKKKKKKKKMGKHIFISQHNLLANRYTFPSDVQ